jgi:hypothetical protein
MASQSPASPDDTPFLAKPVRPAGPRFSPVSPGVNSRIAIQENNEGIFFAGML